MLPLSYRFEDAVHYPRLDWVSGARRAAGCVVRVYFKPGVRQFLQILFRGASENSFIRGMVR